jgi:hypothetical protein
MALNDSIWRYFAEDRAFITTAVRISNPARADWALSYSHYSAHFPQLMYFTQFCPGFDSDSCLKWNGRLLNDAANIGLHSVDVEQSME